LPSQLIQHVPWEEYLIMRPSKIRIGPNGLAPSEENNLAPTCFDDQLVDDLKPSEVRFQNVLFLGASRESLRTKVWGQDISSASERALPGFSRFLWQIFWLLNSLQKKRCFSRQEFIRFLSTVSSQHRMIRITIIQTNLVIVIFSLRVLTNVVSYKMIWN
jgi:hypothetical protein